ncbi:glycosyltransferase family 2 protein [Treponema parvum]|uniref:Glycosyltransferase family 2 protein n=1 Tax=Treponema parvum TaxID=138851 RepID=A0A975F464_9SPIR|nr:glycosyltransferase family 2 protein [Treponema parvum]QTQ11771.1 glycosyltransferase family 2 protein [Treponema parvum]QTQ14072.1 glycosyltransferase family 2 protein [Treponema parvum]QTQ16260.1 glycosyltransferase family 2 protein [Treponema parvum]
MSKVSLIVPCYNEESNIIPFYEEILKTFKDIDADFELLFIDDGSKDKTLEKIKNLHNDDKRVKCVSFARNFGKEAALFAGIRNVTGDCAVILDADLQHPPCVIKEMFQKWKEGFEVVEGIKTSRGKESILHKAFSQIFYGLMSKAVKMDMKNSSDYKLLDKKVIAQLAALKERNTFFRALSFWVGFKKTTVYYEVQERMSGVSKWSTKALTRYAINNVICFSYAPLHIIAVVGFIFIFIAIGVSIDALISFIRGNAAQGFPTIILVLLLGFGAILISLGIIGVYIAQIYDEVKMRPQYVIGEKIE